MFGGGSMSRGELVAGWAGTGWWRHMCSPKDIKSSNILSVVRSKVLAYLHLGRVKGGGTDRWPRYPASDLVEWRGTDSPEDET